MQKYFDYKNAKYYSKMEHICKTQILGYHIQSH
jgi:hypothetical protein